jgi:AcrR family transcriptional regulator
MCGRRASVTQRTHNRKRQSRQEKRQANRERILRAARRVFGARGYRAATIEDIADEAGLSNGAIYYNFASKEELFIALLDERMQERLDHVRQTVASGRDPLSAHLALKRESLDVSRTFKEEREWRLLLLEFVAYAARNPRFGKRLREHQRELHTAVVGILEQLIAAIGVTPAIPTERLAIAITGLVNGLAIEELISPGVVPDELFGEAIGLLLTAHAQT